MAKKTILILMLFFSVINAFSQEAKFIEKKDILDKAIESVDGLMLKYIDSSYYSKYFFVDSNITTVYFQQSLTELKTEKINTQSIKKMFVFLNFKSPMNNGRMEFQVNNEFKVIENISADQRNNYTIELIQSFASFLKSLESNKLLDTQTVYNYVVKLYPDKKWTSPELRKNMFPPYNFYYSVLEHGCSSCERIEVDNLELKEIGKKYVNMIPIND